jgi:LCP family protein required for cell wall assembly
MAKGRPPGDASEPPSPKSRGSAANEGGLRELGSKIGGGSSGSVANEQGLRALGQRVDQHQSRTSKRRGKKGASRWSTKRKVWTGIAAVVIVALLAVAGGYGYLRYRFDQIPKQHIADEQQAASGQPFNMLVLGSDSRVGESSSAFGSSSVVTGQRSDVIQIWHVDPKTKQISVMSIPRDTLVNMVGSDIEQFGEHNRINSAYNSGANQLVATIQANFGIPINHVVQVDFGGFQGAVNALGGVKMNFNYPARDAYSGLNITQTGCQLLNGTQALAVARSRHYEYYANGYWQSDGSGDYGRIDRQDAFLKSLISSAKSKVNPLTVNAFIGSLPQGVVIDDGFSLSEFTGLALDFHSFDPSALQTQTMPTQSIGYVSPWGDVLFIQQPDTQQMLVNIFGDSLTEPTDPAPNTDLESVPPPEVTTTTTTTAGASSSSTTPSATTPTTAAPPSFDPTPC